MLHSIIHNNIEIEKEFFIKFIELYKSLPCLWDNRTDEYTNRREKAKSYERLTKFFKKFDPDANVAIVKKKINNIRSAFRREVRKVQKLRESGDHDYEPTLWYYSRLQFLMDIEPQHSKTSLLNGTASFDMEDNTEMIVLETENLEEINSNETPFFMATSEHDEEEAKPPSPPMKKISIGKNHEKLYTTEYLQTKPLNQKEEEENEFEILGKRVATHFKNMDETQRLIAEKIISDVLIFGRMKKLTLDTQLIIPSSVFESLEENPDGNNFFQTKIHIERDPFSDA